MRRLVSVASVALFAAGCGTKDRPTGTPADFDVGVADVVGIPNDSAKSDTTTSEDTFAEDTGGASDTSVVDTGAPSEGGTVDAPKIDGGDADPSTDLVPIGKLCATSGECDPTGAGTGVCSSTLDPRGTIDPTPICVGSRCDLGTDSIGKACGPGGSGWCVAGGSAGRCLLRCKYGNGSAATGCVGKDVCNPSTALRDGAGTPTGNGFCRAGCRSDADCTGGDKCQPEELACVKALTAYPKSLGQACSSDSDCPCLKPAVVGPTTGYCTRACITGSATACPSGFACDPGLPTSDATGALFTAAPSAVLGSCLKVCTSDADCSAFGAYCALATASSTGQRLCQPTS